MPRDTNSGNQQSSRVLLSMSVASADVKSIRQDTFNGRNYTVLPVVAIVETVVHGANSAAPELALASEFGKFPDSWNGRPVMLGHPTINGVFVSASIPSVLEDFHLGFIFNAYVDQKRLLCEAWVDNERVEALGGEFKDVLDRANAGEEIEVSVGAFLDVRQHKGSHNGKQYQGVWQNVVPDHLAILPKGQTGACSVADGCGTPRVHTPSTPISLRVQAAAAMPRVGACCDSCAAGNGCANHGGAPVALTDSAAAAATGTGGGAAATSTADPATEAPTPPASASSDGDELTAEHALLVERRAELIENFQTLFTVNAVPGTIVMDDIRTLVRQALQEQLNVALYDFELLALTTEVAVYYVWGGFGVFHQMHYSLAADGKVTFTGDPEPVNLLTTIQPRQTSTGPNVQSEGDNDMSVQNGQAAAAAAAAAAAPGGGQGDGEQQQAAPAVNAAGAGDQQEEAPAAPAAPAVLSTDDWLKSAPADVRNIVTRALAQDKARHDGLVKQVLAIQANKLTEAQLTELSDDTLEGMVVLAGNQVDYSGQGGGFADTSLNVQAAAAAPGANFATAPRGFLGKTQQQNNNGGNG